MNKFNFFTLFFIFFCGSCKKPLSKKEIKISFDQMKEVLSDSFIYQSIEGINPKEASNFALEKHKIKAEDFKEAHDYYVLNSIEYLKLIDEIEKDLNTHTQKIEEEIKKEEEFNLKNELEKDKKNLMRDKKQKKPD